jgi:hypothetical protein
MERFETDLFISYAHIDNKPLPPEQQGWISRFHLTLAGFLGQYLGREANIWRDRKLNGNDAFGAEIVAQISGTAVLVSVVTPRYVKSEWCTREIREFCEQAQNTGGVLVANKGRVFKVLKTPVATQDALPDVVKGFLGYEFFRVEDDTPLELDRAFGEALGQDYNRKVAQLAWDIKELVESLTADDGADGNTSTEPVIFLAECSYDRKQDREILEGELRRLGYTVLPDRELPRDETAYVDAVESVLSGCGLSIHLVGTGYGPVPDGPSDKSTVVLQNELAARRSRSAGLQRVIWLPEGTHSDHEPQQAFLDALLKDPEAQFGADLITGDFEALRTTIYAAARRLQEPARAERDATAAPHETRLVYLICTEPDREATVPVRRYLREQGFEVSTPAFEGDAAVVRAVHEQCLAECDAVLLFYGAGNEAWKRATDNELRKLSGNRNGKALLASFTYLADPRTADKEEMVEIGGSDLIDGPGASIGEALSPFVDAVGRNAAAG